MDNIICSKCKNVIQPKDSWDFMDGEEHKILCKCGNKFIVIVERPIEYYVVEAGKHGP